MKNDQLVIVNVNGSYSSVWNFCDADNAMEEIERAKKSAAESIARYQSHIKNYPDRADYWRNCMREYENADYQIMTFEEFLDRQKNLCYPAESRKQPKKFFLKC